MTTTTFADLAGLLDPPTPYARSHAQRCTDTRARDVWERAVLVMMSDLGMTANCAAIAGRLGCTDELVATVRRNLIERRIRPRPSSAAPLPTSTRSPIFGPGRLQAAHVARMDELARERAEITYRQAEIDATTFAGIVHPLKDDEAPAWMYRRRPEPPAEIEAERLLALNRHQVREYLREWKRLMSRSRARVAA